MKPAFIWNVTTKVAPEIHENWLDWLRKVHIPAYLATGCFYDALILKLFEQDGDDGFTYAVQFYARSIEDYKTFASRHYSALHREMMTTWGTDCYGFESALEVVN
ncbi:DUF4286 family protein [Niabella soli]|uniref:DUF4286 family protein n=1 Tax=Niabella soli TaxID=446683 RepID=UPI00024999DF|nr:DUF4286 family protein [Niabella soli]